MHLEPSQQARGTRSPLLAPRPAPPAQHRRPALRCWLRTAAPASALPCAAAARHIVEEEWLKKVLGGAVAWFGGGGKEKSFSLELGCVS
jgi:hypothetical protein